MGCVGSCPHGSSTIQGAKPPSWGQLLTPLQEQVEVSQEQLTEECSQTDLLQGAPKEQLLVESNCLTEADTERALGEIKTMLFTQRMNWRI